MRTLVLGAGEFFAPFIIEELLGRRHTVAALTTSEADLGDGVARLEADPTDGNAVERWVAAWRPDAVIDMLHTGPDHARAVAGACQGRVERSVHLSSLAVYGPNPPLPVEETAELLPAARATGEAAARIEADRVVLEAIERGAPAAIVRLPHVYGPRDPRCAEWYFAKRALDGRARVAVPDGGLAICHRGFVQNMAWGVAQAVTCRRAAGQIYHLGEEKVSTLGQFARAVARALDHEWDIYSVPGRLLRTPYDRTLFADLRKARAHLRYRDRMIPRDGLELTLGWLCQSPPADWRWPGIEAPFDYRREDALIEEHGVKLEV